MTSLVLSRFLPRLLDWRLMGDTLPGHTRGGVSLMSRNARVHREMVWVLISGFAEPFLYLLSLGYGMAQLVGSVPYAGRQLDYEAYVAPAMLAAAAMTGAVVESTYNIFAKLKFVRLYDAVLATPVTPLGIALGEIGWAVARCAAYSAFFVVIMAALGLTSSVWVIAAVPAAVLMGLAFSAVGMACTTYMRSWYDFDYVTVAIFLLFLFSETFAPIDVYPEWAQALVLATPLYHGVALARGLSTGEVSVGLLWHVVYLAGLAVVGLLVTGRRMQRRLAP